MTVAAGVAALAVMAAFLVARPRPPASRLDHLARGRGRRPTPAVPGPERPGRRGPRGRRGRRGRPSRSPSPRSRSASVPMVLDLVAEVVASGAAPPRALVLVAECLERAGDPAARELLLLAGRSASAEAGHAGEGSPAPPVAGAGPQGLRALSAAVELAVSTGAGPVGLIRAAAQEERRRTHAARIAGARRAGVLVLLPTGLCLLPAFVLLTVVPLVIDLVLG